MDLSVFTVKESKAICGYGCIPVLSGWMSAIRTIPVPMRESRLKTFGLAFTNSV